MRKVSHDDDGSPSFPRILLNDDDNYDDNDDDEDDKDNDDNDYVQCILSYQ